MKTTKKISVSLPTPLFNQTEALAQHLGLSQNRLVELALEQFISHYPTPPAATATPDMNEESAAAQSAAPDTTGRRVIHQGDVYWVQLDDASGLEPGIPHPHVILQADVFNHSRIQTVVACALTSNIRRASLPGNILLAAGEANLPRPSVVEASKVSAVAKTRLGDYIGALSEERVLQILAGMRFLQRSFFAP